MSSLSARLRAVFDAVLADVASLEATLEAARDEAAAAATASAASSAAAEAAAVAAATGPVQAALTAERARSAQLHLANSPYGPWTPFTGWALPSCNNPTQMKHPNGTWFIICDR